MLKPFSLVLLVLLLCSASAVAVPTPPKVTDKSVSGVSVTKELDREKKSVSFAMPKVKRPGIVRAARAGVVRDHEGSVVRPRRGKAKRLSPAKAVSSMVNLRGVVIYADSWDYGTYAYGVYTVPTSDGASFERLLSFDYAMDFGAVDDGNGTFTAVYNSGIAGLYYLPYVATFDTETWSQLTDEGAPDYSCMSRLAVFDPSTKQVYGYYYDADMESIHLGIGDYEHMTSSVISPGDNDMAAIGVTKDGQFYGVDKEAKLYKIDKATGGIEFVAQTEAYTDYAAGGCVNDIDNTFLMSYSTDDKGGLYEIDLATGATSIVTEFADGEQVLSLYIAKPLAEDKAPAAPKMTATCAKGAMDVDISLAMPETLFDGTSAAGQTFDYAVTSGGTELLKGTATAGRIVTKTFAMAETGMAYFEATAANAVGSSPRVKASCFVGKGVPAAPAEVSLAWDGGKSSLSWTAVAESADGGYIDPAAITYTVLDAGGKELAKGISATSWTCDYPEPSGVYVNLYYSVRAVYADKTSDSTDSNVIGIGSYSAPVVIDFTAADGETLFGQHNVLDANDDGRTWEYSYSAQYKYHETNIADDWLMSPALNLESGKIYQFKAYAYGSALYPERIEVKCGMGATAADMSIALIEPTELACYGDEVMELKALLRPSVTGKYHIGFHALSDADRNRLIVNSYEVGSPMNPTAPGECTAISIRPDTKGALSASISFAAPKVDLAGNAISGKVSVKVFRNDTEIKTLEGAAGEKLSFTDQVEAPETYAYTFVPYVAGSEGISASASAYIGPRVPASVAYTDMRLINGKTIKLDWEAVTTDADGNLLPPGNKITYNIYTVEEENGQLYFDEKLNAEPLTVTTFTYTPPQLPGEQSFYYLAIEPVNSGMVAGGAIAAKVIVGEAYEMPICYSDEQSVENYLMSAGATTAYHGNFTLESYDSFGYVMEAVDGDDTFFVIEHMNNADAIGTKTYISTGKIRISGDYPVLSFYDFKVADNCYNLTEVSVICDNEEKVLESYAGYSLPLDGWNRVKTNLSAYKGKDVIIRVGGVLRSHLYNIYDRIEIKDDYKYDLGVAISGPTKVAANEKFDVIVVVENNGALECKGAAVELHRDGAVVDTKEVDAVPADDAVTLKFAQTISVVDEYAEYSAVVRYAADENAANNATEPITVVRRKSNLPIVTGLDGKNEVSGNALRWNAVDRRDFPLDPISDDLESATSWEHGYADWTFIDNDGEPVGSFDGLDVPGITAGQTKASFFVFDSSADGFNASFAAHSGSKYLAALFRYDDWQSDDWAVSPELSGDMQTISFWAKSYSGEYPEWIEILYSTTDAEISSFETAVKVQEVPADWTEFTADLPAGTRYFAIRSCGEGSYMLMVDDVTYSPAGGECTLEHLGYNVYRDNVKVNDRPITSNSYVDVVSNEKSHTYHVTTVFDRGESEISEPITIETTGIEDLSAGVKVYVDGYCIVVEGAASKCVSITQVDGRVIYNREGDTRVEVSAGIYLVTVGGQTVKVMVR